MENTNNYEILKETYVIVGRVEEKLDKMGERVSVLEIWKSEIMGKLTVIIAIITFGTTLLWQNLKEKLGFK